MKIFSNKKSEALTIILVVLIVVVFIGWLVNLGSRECRTDAHCGSGNYCGSDFSCHEIPTIEKTIVKNNLILPSIIVGIAIIIAAIVLKWGKIPFRTRNNEESEQKQEHKNSLKLP